MSLEAKTAAERFDAEVSTFSGLTDASAVQTHGHLPSTRILPEELTRFLAPPERPDEIGRLGPYRILEVLGQGGMGVVFRAHDPALDRIVALKAMLPGVAAGPTVSGRLTQR